MIDEAKLRARQKRARQNRANNHTPFWLLLDNDMLADLRRLHGGKHGGVTEAIRTYIAWGLDKELKPDEVHSVTGRLPPMRISP